VKILSVSASEPLINSGRSSEKCWTSIALFNVSHLQLLLCLGQKLFLLKYIRNKMYVCGWGRRPPDTVGSCEYVE